MSVILKHSVNNILTSVISATVTCLLTMDLYLAILLMILAFCVGLIAATCCLLYFLLFKRQVKPDTTIKTDPSTFVHFPSPGLTPFNSTRPSIIFSSSLEDSLGSTMSFGRILANHQANILEHGLQNILAVHEQAYLESLEKGGVDMRKTLGHRRMLEKRYPTKQLFHSTLPTIADVPKVHRSS